MRAETTTPQPYRPAVHVSAPLQCGLLLSTKKWLQPQYIAIGLFGATTLGENEIGSLSRMGPGYFPLIISTGIILTGLAIAVKSLLLTPALPSEGRIELGRPFSGLLILGSVALYAATLLTLGFVLSISLMVIAASCAHPLFRLRDAVISAVILTTLSALLFVGGLGLIVPMWPTFF